MYIMIQVQWTYTVRINLLDIWCGPNKNNTHTTENINHCTNCKLLLCG